MTEKIVFMSFISLIILIFCLFILPYSLDKEYERMKIVNEHRCSQGFTVYCEE